MEEVFNINSLISGEVYHITYENGNKYIMLSTGGCKAAVYIGINNKEYGKRPTNFDSRNEKWKIRRATYQEEEWLRICEERKTFVPFEEISFEPTNYPIC